MPMRTHSFALFLLLSASAFCGCNSEPPAPPTVPETTGTTSTFDASKVPETPDEAVANVVFGLQDRHPEALWHFLPESYQNDVNDLIHQFAGRMDPELWSKTVAVLKKAVKVVKQQKEFVIAMTARAPGAPPDASPDILGVIQVIDFLLESELGDLQRLKKADAGEFLAVTGGRIMQQLQAVSKLIPSDPLALGFDDLSDLKVSVVSSEGDQAVLLIEAPGAEPRETEFVRVEGKWIPRNLAESWIDSIGQAKARLLLVSPENLAQIKPQWLAMIKSIDGKLDDAADAKDQQQFSAALLELGFSASPLVGLIQSSLPAAPAMESPEQDIASDLPETTADLVTVVVRGKLDSAAQDMLVDRLKSATEEEKAFAEFTGDDKLTSFKIGPVKDIDAFVERLTFLNVTKVDAASRTISAVPR